MELLEVVNKELREENQDLKNKIELLENEIASKNQQDSFTVDYEIQAHIHNNLFC